MPSALVSRMLGSAGTAVFLLRDETPWEMERALSVAELREGVQATAGALARAGVRPSDRVVLGLSTGEPFIRWFLAAQWLGAVPIPVPVPTKLGATWMGLERAAAVLESSRPAAVVIDPRVHDVLEDRLAGVTVLPAGPVRGESAPLREPSPGAPAFVQYTAGSTGRPKGVMVTYRNLEANLEAIGAAVRVGPGDSVLSWLPLYHDMGLVGTLLFSLYFHLPLFLYSPRGFMLRPLGWLRAMSQHRATLSAGPHFAYSLCARRIGSSKLEGLDLSSWRLALDGSEPIHVTNIRAFIERFRPHGFRPEAYHPVYGMAEATLAVAFSELGEPPHVDRVQRAAFAEGRAAPAAPEDPGALEFVSVGRAIPGVQVEIRAPRDGALRAERELGEIWVYGASVSPGYLNEDAPPRSGFKTGDLGYVADGRLYVVDRLNDLIIHAGINLNPSDLEEAVGGVEGVRAGRVVALGIPTEEEGTERIVVVAEVGRENGRQAVQRSIRVAVAQRCGFPPEEVMLVPPRTLPLTTSGKLRRSAAKQLFLEGRLGA